MEYYTPQDAAIFNNAAQIIRAVDFRRELRVTEIDSPDNIAPSSLALAGVIHLDCQDGEDFNPLESIYGSGRFALFHDPASADIWGSDFRVVTFASAPLDPEIGADHMVHDVCWAWLTDALDTFGAEYTASAGTVTKSTSFGYGQLAEQGEGAVIEIRASWSVTDNNFAAHTLAWGQLISNLAGLPDVEGIASLNAFRLEKMSLRA